MYRRFAILLTSALGVWAHPVAAIAQSYGAIAMSPATQHIGYSYDFGSKGAAEKRALSECSQEAGDCEIMVWFKDSCASLAVDRTGTYGWAWHSSRDRAARDAMSACTSRGGAGCTIRETVCTSTSSAGYTGGSPHPSTGYICSPADYVCRNTGVPYPPYGR